MADMLRWRERNWLTQAAAASFRDLLTLRSPGANPCEGFLLQVVGVESPRGLLAVRELDRARLLREGTLCWDSMPAATREWMRANRSPLAAHWNGLTRLQAEDVHNAA